MRGAAKVCAAEALPRAKLWAPPAPPEVRAETIQRILSSHDRLDVEATARAELERLLRYHDAGHVNLLIVTIIESQFINHRRQ